MKNDAAYHIFSWTLCFIVGKV